jgi:hypothetical protein
MRQLTNLESSATGGEYGPFLQSVHRYPMFGKLTFRPLIWFSPEKVLEEQEKCRPNEGPIGSAVLELPKPRQREARHMVY